MASSKGKSQTGFKAPPGFGLVNDGYKKELGMTAKKDGLVYVDPEDQESVYVNYKLRRGCVPRGYPGSTPGVNPRSRMIPR